MKTTSPFKFFIAAHLLVLMLATVPAGAQVQDRGLGIYLKAEDGKVIKLYEKSYALVIGVSDYVAGWPKLPGVRHDVEAVTRALEKQGFQVTVVKNPDSVQLDKAFKEFIDTYGLGTENRLLFYFAGHGHTIKQSYGEEMGYIVPLDAPNPNTDRSGFMRKAMDMQLIEGYARRIQSKHALFLFDSCFSGALFALSRAVPASITYKTARPVRQFITSGSAEEQVPDESIFRRQFIEAIEGEADSNADNYITGTELGDFLQDRVINYSKNAQHPQYGKIRNPNLDKGDFVFTLPKRIIPDAGAQPAETGNNRPSQSAAPPQRSTPADNSAMELAFWTTIQSSNDPEDFRAYLKKFPNGVFAELAKKRAQPPAQPSPSVQVNSAPVNSPPVKAQPQPNLPEKNPPIINNPVNNPATNTEAVRVKEPGKPNLTLKAKELNAQRQFDQAIELATEALRLDPALVGAYFERGYAYYFKKDLNNAIADFTAAIKVEPNFLEAYHMRGNTNLFNKDFNNAITDFTTVIRLNPKLPLAHYGRGFAKARSGALESAIIDFTEAIRLDPTLWIGYFEKGQVYMMQKDYRKAIAAYTEVIRIDSKQVKAYYARAGAYELAGESELAETDRQTAKALEQRK